MVLSRFLLSYQQSNKKYLSCLWPFCVILSVQVNFCHFNACTLFQDGPNLLKIIINCLHFNNTCKDPFRTHPRTNPRKSWQIWDQERGNQGQGTLRQCFVAPFQTLRAVYSLLLVIIYGWSVLLEDTGLQWFTLGPKGSQEPFERTWACPADCERQWPLQLHRPLMCETKTKH